MAKKNDAKKNKKTVDIVLTPEESDELQMVADRLAVQNPEGESLGNYLKSLGSILKNREHMVAAIIDRLAATPTRVGFLTYLALREDVTENRYKKVLKQAAYRFGQKGFEESTAEETETVYRIPREIRKPVAHFIPADEAFWLVCALLPDEGPAPAPPSIVIFFADDEALRMNAQAFEGSNRLYREMLLKFTDVEYDRKPVEIPVEHAARLFFDMLEMGGTKSLSQEAEYVRRLLRPFHDPEKPSLAHELLGPVDDPGREIAGFAPENVHGERLTQLLAGMDLSMLLFPEEELRPYLVRLEELATPVIVVSEAIREERGKEIVRRAADELCVGPRRKRMCRFFEEYALWLKLSGKDALAETAWIIAAHLAGDDPAGLNPLVVDIARISCSRCLEAAEGDEGEPEDDGYDEIDDAPFIKTDSGLILPR